MLRRPQTTAFWVGRLPHWEVEGGRYFITLHLAGAIPAVGRTKLRQIAAQLRQTDRRNAPQWLRIQRAVFAEMERWLDRAKWNPLLQRPDMAAMVADAIEHRRQRGDWVVHEYVIMPTHVHLFCEFGAHGMKAVMEDFKRWTGHRAAELQVGQAPPGRRDLPLLATRVVRPLVALRRRRRPHHALHPQQPRQSQPRPRLPRLALRVMEQVGPFCRKGPGAAIEPAVAS